MWCKFPYNENFEVFPKKHAGGNENLIINFAWPNHAYVYMTSPLSDHTPAFCLACLTGTHITLWYRDGITF